MLTDKSLKHGVTAMAKPTTSCQSAGHLRKTRFHGRHNLLVWVLGFFSIAQFDAGFGHPWGGYDLDLMPRRHYPCPKTFNFCAAPWR